MKILIYLGLKGTYALILNQFSDFQLWKVYSEWSNISIYERSGDNAPALSYEHLLNVGDSFSSCSVATHNTNVTASEKDKTFQLHPE